MNIFVYYPKVFNVKTKFNRKLDNILLNVENANILYLEDENFFLGDYFTNKSNFILNKITSLTDMEITHAIIFDDGEEFYNQNSIFFNENNINTRFIKINITRVVNITKQTEFKNLKSTPSYEYIGRGSYWGNPYSMYEFGDDDNSREEVISRFKYDFDYDKFPKKEKSQVYKLVGKRLGCFCKPEACHGDVLADFLNSWDDGN